MADGKEGGGGIRYAVPLCNENGEKPSLYVCRHAERLDTSFPNWHQLIQTKPFNWPPGFSEV